MRSKITMGAVTPVTLQIIASAQGGAVVDHQIRSCGVSSKKQLARVANGHWQSCFGVTVIPECVIDSDLRDAWAITLRIGKNAIITGPTAARLHGIAVESRLVLAASPRREHVRVPGARILRRPPLRLPPRSGGLRLTSAEEAILDTLEVLPAREAERMLYVALQQHWISTKFIESALAVRRKLRQHIRALSRLHALVRGGTQSHAERRMRILLRAHKIRGWKGNYRINDGSGRPIASIDFAKVNLKIAIEVDGRSFHSDRRAFEHDRARQNKLTLAGWTVLRFTWDQITKTPGQVVRTVRESIRLRTVPSL